MHSSHVQREIECLASDVASICSTPCLLAPVADSITPRRRRQAQEHPSQAFLFPVRGDLQLRDNTHSAASTKDRPGGGGGGV